MAGERGVTMCGNGFNNLSPGENMSVRQQVREFILSNYLFTNDEAALRDAESLMGAGAMDSTGILELIMFLEERFDIKVEDAEMIPANLDSVTNVVSFVERKRTAQA